MQTCDDCNTPLKHLFGRQYFCPNECDLKEKVDTHIEVEFPEAEYIIDHITSRTNQNIDFSNRQVSGNLVYINCKFKTDKNTEIRGVTFGFCVIEGAGTFRDCTFTGCIIQDKDAKFHNCKFKSTSVP